MWFVVSASAHVGQPVAGIDLVSTPDGWEIEASYGLLLPEAGGTWGWVCHEALSVKGAVRSPRFTRAPAPGVARLGVLSDPAQGRDGHTIFRSVDGCAWDPVESLAGHTVREASFDPDLADRAVAVSDAALFVSDDAGATFTEVAAPRSLRSARSLGGVVVAFGVDQAQTSAFLLTWDRDVWTEVALPSGSPPLDGRVAGLSPGRAADVVLDAFGPDTVLSVVGDVVEVVWSAPGQVTDVARDGETVFVVRDGQAMVSVRDGVVTEVAAFPLGFGVELAGDVIFTAPQSWVEGALLSRSDDGGASFPTAAFPDDVRGPLACGPETHVTQICGPLWTSQLPDLRGYDEPSDDDDAIPDLDDPDRPKAVVAASPPEGCGCGQVPGAGWISAATALALLRRRRSQGTLRDV